MSRDHFFVALALLSLVALATYGAFTFLRALDLDALAFALLVAAHIVTLSFLYARLKS